MINQETLDKIKDFLVARCESLGMDDCYYYQDDCECEDEDHFYDMQAACCADDVRWGASKIVFFYDDLPDWVIKVPFFGTYNIDTDEYYDFCRANECGDGNYCQVEADIALDADREGVGACFAHTYYVTCINGIPYYASEKIEDTLLNSDEPQVSEASSSAAENLSESYDLYELSLCDEVLAMFIEQYGETMAENLLKFLYDQELGDFHRNNLGVDAEGRIKIIDYSDYNE